MLNVTKKETKNGMDANIYDVNCYGVVSVYFSQGQIIITICDINWTQLKPVRLPRIPSINERIVFMEPKQNVHYLIKDLLWVVNEQNHLAVMVACDILTERRKHLSVVPPNQK